MQKSISVLTLRFFSCLITSLLIISSVSFFKYEKVTAATEHNVFWNVRAHDSSSPYLIEYFSDSIDAVVGDTVVLSITAGGEYTNVLTEDNLGGTVLDSSTFSDLSYSTSFEYNGNSVTTATYLYLGEYTSYDPVDGFYSHGYKGYYTLTINWIPPQYTVEFVDHDGAVLQTSSYESGKMPEYTEKDPSGYVDEMYEYTFSGWNAEIVAVTADTTYQAQYSRALRKFNVDFLSDDGTSLQKGVVEYGQAPVFSGTTPTKAETDRCTYTFIGWTDGTKKYGPTDTLPAVTADISYKAIFEEISKPNEYYVDSINGDGSDGSIVIIVKANGEVDNSFDLFDRVEAGGKVLTVGSDIEVNRGSTIITLKKSYLDSLSDGLNTITVFFTDGGSITVNYSIKKTVATNAATVPATGESMSISTFVGAGLIMTAVSLAGYNVMKKREEDN